MNEPYASSEADEDPPWFYALKGERLNRNGALEPVLDDQGKWSLRELLNSLKFLDRPKGYEY
jgi:hypothetical protein